MPRSLRPTQAGWLFFAITLGVGFAALNTGNNLMYLVLALLLAFLVLSGVLSESALASIRVRRRLPGEIHAERDNGVVLEVTNGHGRFPAFAIVVEDRRFLPDEPGLRGTRWVAPAGRVFVLRVGPGETERRRYALRPTRRGPLELAHFAVSTRFPFGLFLKTRIIDAPAEALVFPAVDPLPMASPPLADRRSGDLSRLRPGSGDHVAGLREFQPGDSLRRVHWRHSVRRGELSVKLLEQDSAGAIEVRLRTNGAGAKPGEAASGFERAVRRAASEVVASLDAGLRVGLRTDDVLLPASVGRAQRRRLLTHLARVEPSARLDRTAAIATNDAAADRRNPPLPGRLAGARA